MKSEKGLNNMFEAILFLIIIFCAIYLTIDIIVHEIIDLVHTLRYKKKSKDKRIKLFVRFICYETYAITLDKQIFYSESDLADCVKQALIYAKKHNGKIDSMKLLTTK